MSDIQITINDNVNDFISRLNEMSSTLDSASSKASNTGSSIASGLEKAGTAAQEAEGKAKSFGETLEGIGSHAGKIDGLAGAFGGLGGPIAEAAAAVDGLAGAFAALEKAAPELLAIAAALAAVMAAFNFVKDGIADAAAFQSQMETLGGAVKAQGGNWDELKDKVESWANTESIASGITKDQLVTALNSLVTAGMDVKSAMAATSIAEEVATARHVQLSEVTNDLISAEAGRTQGLARLDANLKPLIARHASLSQIMAQLHKDDKNAIDDNNSLEMAHNRLNAAVSAVGEKLGDFFLPILAKLVTATLGEMDAIGQLWEAMGSGLHLLVDLGASLRDLAVGFDAMAHGNVGAAAAAFKDLGNQGKTALNDIKDGAHAMGNAIYDAFHPLNAAASTISAAISGHDADANAADIAGGALGNTKSGAGHHKKKGAGSHFEFTAIADQLKPAAQSVDTLAEKLKNLTKDVQGYNQEIALLHPAINQEQYEHDQLTGKLNAAHTAYENARQKANKFGEELKSQTTPVTEKQKETLNNLEGEVTKAKTAYDTLDGKLKTVNSTLQKHKDELDAAKKALEDLNKKHQDFIDTIARESRDMEATYGKSTAQQIAYYEQQLALIDRTTAAGEALWEQYYKKIADLRDKDFQDTINKQKQALQEQEKDINTFLTDVIVQHKSLKDELKSVYDDILKNFIDMVTKMIVESTLFKTVMQSGFMQGLMGGMGFNSTNNPFMQSTGGATDPLTKSATNLTTSANDLKTASQQIVQQFHDPEQQLTQSGTNMNSAATALQQAAQQLDNAATALQQMGSGGGSGSGSGGGIFSLLSGNGGIPEFNTGDVFNVPSGPATDSSGAYLPNTNINDIADATQQQTSVTSAYAPTNVTLDKSSVGDMSKSFGSVMGGALMGYSMGQQMAPGNPWAAGLGAAGGAIGEYFGGPVGEAIGSTAGAFIGSLFGPHWGPAVNYPDRSDTQNFGTEAADMTGAGLNGKGAYNANGTPFTEQSQLSQASGGKSGLAWVEETLAKYAKPGTTDMASNAPSWLQPIWSQLVSMFGVSATGSGQLNFGTHIGDQWVTGAAGAGGVDPNNPGAYQQYAQLLNQFYQGMQGTPGAESVFNISNMAPDYNQINMSNIGTYDPTTGTFTPSSNGNNSSGSGSGSSGNGAGSGGAGGGTGRGPIQVPINVHVEGSVIKVNDLANELSQIIQRNLATNRYNTGVGL